MNRPERDDEGPDFERLLDQLDHDRDLAFGFVRIGRNDVLSDRGAERLGRSLLGFTTRNGGRLFHSIGICAYYMTDNAFRYSSLLEFFATGRYGHVVMHQDTAWNAPEPGMMAAAMGHILTAMLANPQPVATHLNISGASLTMQSLHLANQFPEVTLVRCRMEALLQEPLTLPDDTTNRDDRPERGSRLRLATNNDWSGILQAAATLRTNVTSVYLSFTDRIVGPLDLSNLIGFVAAQPNGMAMILSVNPSSQLDGETIVEHILAGILTHCPGVYSLRIENVNAALSPVFREQHFPRLLALVSDSNLTEFDFRERAHQGTRVLSMEQEQQITVMTQRNRIIPMYLETIHLLKPRQPQVPPIVVYNKDGQDRPKHQFVLSHALRQAAVHPVYFSHFYEFVRHHSNELPGGRDRRNELPGGGQATGPAAAQPPL
jgi:hypothetical protein